MSKQKWKEYDHAAQVRKEQSIYTWTKMKLTDVDGEEIEFFQSGEEMGDVQNIGHVVFIEVTDVKGRKHVFINDTLRQQEEREASNRWQ